MLMVLLLILLISPCISVFFHPSIVSHFLFICLWSRTRLHQIVSHNLEIQSDEYTIWRLRDTLGWICFFFLTYCSHTHEWAMSHVRTMQVVTYLNTVEGERERESKRGSEREREGETDIETDRQTDRRTNSERERERRKERMCGRGMLLNMWKRHTWMSHGAPMKLCRRYSRAWNSDAGTHSQCCVCVDCLSMGSHELTHSSRTP